LGFVAELLPTTNLNAHFVAVGVEHFFYETEGVLPTDFLFIIFYKNGLYNKTIKVLNVT
jgi:hypothetical protein